MRENRSKGTARTPERGHEKIIKDEATMKHNDKRIKEDVKMRPRRESTYIIKRDKARGGDEG